MDERFLAHLELVQTCDGWIVQEWPTVGIRPDEVVIKGVGAEPIFVTDGDESGSTAVDEAAVVRFVTEMHARVQQVQWLGDGSLVELELQGNNSKTGSSSAAYVTL